MRKKYRLSGETLKVTPDMTPDILIIEGILVFYYPKIRELCQMKLFVDCDADTRLSRRVLRDMNDYHRPLDQVLAYYQKYVKPAFEEFCLPTKKYADVIIPRGAENSVAINLIVQHLNDYLNSNHQENAYVRTPESSPNCLLHRTPLAVATNLASHSANSSKSNSPNTTPQKRSETSSRPH